MGSPLDQSPGTSGRTQGAKQYTSGSYSNHNSGGAPKRFIPGSMLPPAPENVTYLVRALISSPAACDIFREVGPTRAILANFPEAETLAAWALAGATEFGPREIDALSRRMPGCRSWAEEIEGWGWEPWPDEWYCSDVRRCMRALAKSWMPDTLRWCVQRFDQYRMRDVCDLAAFYRAGEPKGGDA